MVQAAPTSLGAILKTAFIGVVGGCLFLATVHSSGYLEQKVAVHFNVPRVEFDYVPKQLQRIREENRNRISKDSITAFPTVDIVVVGAGLSGAVIAERYARLLNKKVLVLERRPHIAGNCYDYVDTHTGVLVNLYGAHLFHTNYEDVWNYLQQFSGFLLSSSLRVVLCTGVKEMKVHAAWCSWPAM